MGSTFPRVALTTALLLAAYAAAGQTLPGNMANKLGFPVTLAGGKSSHGEPVWADLGLTGGRKSLIFGTYGRKLYVVNHDGTVASGWPKTLPGDVASSPAVGDLDGDGEPDIVVGYGSTIETALMGSSVGGVRAYRRNGTLMWERIAGNFSGATQPPVMSTPAIGDIDGDGVAWVAWGGLDAKVYLVKGSDGTNRTAWPIFVRDTIFSSPTLYDLDGDGKLEVIIGTDSHADPTANPPGVPPTINGGRLHVLRWNATEFPGFPKDVNEVIISSPVVGDIDGDGKPEIVVGTGTYYSIHGGALSTKALYAWKCDGSVPAGWPVTLTGRVIGSPALADIEGNGTLDVVVSDLGSGPGSNFVYVFRGNGSLVWKTAPKDYFGNNLNAGQPVVADVMGDGKLEVLVNTNTEICILSSTGAQLTADLNSHATKPSLYTTTTVSSAAIDVDNGVMNIAAISATPFPSADDSKVYAWTTDRTTSPPWGFFRRTPDRTGAIPGSGACGVVIPPLAGPLRFTSLSPCRVVDTRNPDGPLGGPVLAAGTNRAFAVASACGIPSDAEGVSLNVTVADATSVGRVLLWPGSGPAPTTNTISFPLGGFRANNVVVGLLGGVLSVRDEQASGTVNVIMDVNGYFR